MYEHNSTFAATSSQIYASLQSQAMRSGSTGIVAAQGRFRTRF